MEQIPSLEADGHSVSQEIPSPLFKPKVQNRVHKTPPLNSILRQINSVHTLFIYFRKRPWKLHMGVIHEGDDEKYYNFYRMETANFRKMRPIKFITIRKI
jgi:hypothetical protein